MPDDVLRHAKLPVIVPLIVPDKTPLLKLPLKVSPPPVSVNAPVDVSKVPVNVIAACPTNLHVPVTVTTVRSDASFTWAPMLTLIVPVCPPLPATVPWNVVDVFGLGLGEGLAFGLGDGTVVALVPVPDVIAVRLLLVVPPVQPTTTKNTNANMAEAFNHARICIAIGLPHFQVSDSRGGNWPESPQLLGGFQIWILLRRGIIRARSKATNLLTMERQCSQTDPNNAIFHSTMTRHYKLKNPAATGLAHLEATSRIELLYTVLQTVA